MQQQGCSGQTLLIPVNPGALCAVREVPHPVHFAVLAHCSPEPPLAWVVSCPPLQVPLGLGQRPRRSWQRRSGRQPSGPQRRAVAACSNEHGAVPEATGPPWAMRTLMLTGLVPPTRACLRLPHGTGPLEVVPPHFIRVAWRFVQ